MARENHSAMLVIVLRVGDMETVNVAENIIYKELHVVC